MRADPAVFKLCNSSQSLGLHGIGVFNQNNSRAEETEAQANENRNDIALLRARSLVRVATHHRARIRNQNRSRNFSFGAASHNQHNNYHTFHRTPTGHLFYLYKRVVVNVFFVDVMFEKSKPAAVT